MLREDTCEYSKTPSELTRVSTCNGGWDDGAASEGHIRKMSPLWALRIEGYKENLSEIIVRIPSLLSVMTLSQFDYIFAIGTFFALLDAFNNGASEYLRVFAPR